MAGEVRWVLKRGRWPRRLWRFSLVAANGEKVVTSGDGYLTKASARHGIEVVRHHAETAPLDDRT